MNTRAKAQLHALDRVMYLLEENSFNHLKMDNEAFAAIVEELYAKVSREAELLRRK